MNGLTVHHLGCAVKDLDRSLDSYRQLLGPARRSPTFTIESQGVKVCFLELGSGVYLELVQGLAKGSVVERYVGTGFYHLCFLVDDLDRAISSIPQSFRALPAFVSDAFGGKRCQFVVSPELHLVELAETTATDFSRAFDVSAIAVT